MGRVHAAPELDPFVSITASGLDLLGAPQEPEVMEEPTPERYGELNGTTVVEAVPRDGGAEVVIALVGPVTEPSAGSPTAG